MNARLMNTRKTGAEAGTLHQRIRADIEGRILTGTWRPGHRIPFEHELMAQYGCARMTVNKALASLVDAGLIVRRRRVGSFVAQPRMQSVVLEIPDIQADITSRGEIYGLKLLSRRRRRPSAKRVDEKTLAGEGELLAVRCLHLANGRPFALEERLISLATVPDAENVDFSVEPPGTWLLGHVPWTEAEHRITAINADADIASTLEVKVHTACLELERRTWRGSEHITHVRQVFPGSAYDLIARFRPRRAQPARRA
ncbi:MAG TPA: histidine utilization repressor [Steroidobacteraceae bacterium]|nr:histidine utilization repressor [Steroidobacteraceae bacterium]